MRKWTVNYTRQSVHKTGVNNTDKVDIQTSEKGVNFEKLIPDVANSAVEEPSSSNSDPLNRKGRATDNQKFNKGSTSAAAMSVSLQKALEARRGPLNEIECLAVLGQALKTVQTLVETPFDISNPSSLSKRVHISTETLCCSPEGSVDLEPNHNYRSFVPDDQLVSTALRTLGDTLGRALAFEDSVAISEQNIKQAFKSPTTAETQSLLSSITNGELKTLTEVETLVNARWHHLVGKTPLARFVSQICKVTLGWTSIAPSEDQTATFHSTVTTRQTSTSQLSSTSTLHRVPLCASSPVKDNGATSEQNFKLTGSDDDVSMSSKVSVTSSQVTGPTSFRGQGGYGRRLEYRYPSSSSSQTGSSSTTHRKRSSAVKRNPSRLYRVVKPLAEIQAAPSPATKRCIGPEFVVMQQEKEPQHLDLCSHASKKDVLSVSEVEVNLLDGRRWTVTVNPTTATSGDVLEGVLREAEIGEAGYHSLAIQLTGARDSHEEYCPLANEVKLAKVAPQGWKDPLTACKNNNLLVHHTNKLVLHQRFRHLPRDLESRLRDPKNKHLLYLQLRREVLAGRYRMSLNHHLSLAAMALQVEFGDFSEDVHGVQDYFMLEHYVPRHLVDSLGITETRTCLEKLHRGHLGQSQSKTELKFVREVEALPDFGFHLFRVSSEKHGGNVRHLHHGRSSDRLIGINVDGIFLFDQPSSSDPTQPHRVASAYHWNKIARIQYDKTRFQLLISNNVDGHDGGVGGSSGDKEQSEKIKFYVSETKSKLLFDLASAHHQFSNKLRQQLAAETAAAASQAVTASSTEYREPQRALRSLKSRLLSRRKSEGATRGKLYTGSATSTPTTGAGSSLAARRTLMKSGGSGGSASMRRSLTTAAMSPKKTPGKDNSYLVKRLAHYTSMADALIHTKSQASSKSGHEEKLNLSDKENSTPVIGGSAKNYRYKFYIEPEDDENPSARQMSAAAAANSQPCPKLQGLNTGGATGQTSVRQPLQEKPVSSYYPEAAVSAANGATPAQPNPTKRRPRTIVSTTSKYNTRGRGDKQAETSQETPGGQGGRARMGTRISLSALHRERLRLTSDLGLPPPPPMVKHPSTNSQHSHGGQPLINDDLTLMETKSILPRPPAPQPANAYVVEAEEAIPFNLNDAESLNDSLMERFDAMEAVDTEPERRINCVTLHKDSTGKLGLKIAGTPCGIFVEELYTQTELRKGDRIVAINGRSLENVSYQSALELIKKSQSTVQFIVSQVTTRC